MTIIRVPQPPRSAVDKNRPVSSLLKTQIKHMQEAELRLPARSQTNTYINAIKTEGEAAEYIRQVTEALHREHAAAGSQRAAKKAKRGKKFAIAAMAKGSGAKRKGSTRKRKSTTASRRKSRS